jgi:cytochrome bd-type quinol oxidase subunit 2
MSKEKWIKVGKGALIALGGALVAYIPQAIEMIDWGQWLPLVVALSSIIINAIRVYLREVSENTYEFHGDWERTEETL